MKKKRIYEINLIDDEFKKIKKNKKNIIICLNNDEYKDIKLKDKIILINGKKKLNKKVKKLHKYSTYEELCKNVKKKKLGYKKKESINFNKLDNVYDKDDIKKYGILGIEVNIKKHIFRKILLSILLIVLVILGVYFIDNKLDELNSIKVNESINKLQKDKTDYIFIDINPSLVLTLKESVVNDVACLNDDCMSFYDEIEVKGKSIDESIDSLYNLSKEKGFDVSNGVKIKTTSNLNLDEKDYVSVEHIDNTTENELLSNIKNNEDIKNNNNDNYYNNLWEELKKDKDYGKIYSCNMNDDKLECYFIMSAIDHSYNSINDYDVTSEEEYYSFLSIMQPLSNNVNNTLKKFGVSNQDNIIYINGIEFTYMPLYTLQYVPYKNVLRGKKIEKFPNEFCNMDLVEYDENGKCQILDGFYIIYLETFNLLNPSASLENMIVNEMGRKNKILQAYEAKQMLEE